MRNKKLFPGLTATLAMFVFAGQILCSSAGAQTEQVLHYFNDSGDGAVPASGLIFDASGNLYGTTSSGGANFKNLGAVFQLTPAAGGGWTETLLHSFSGLDGVWPFGSLVRDPAGNLYGTTAYGGGGSVTYCGQGGCGTVFELSPRADGGWTQKVLHSFRHNGTDGLVPYAGMVLDAGGNLYGTTLLGGSYGKGAVFELTPNATGGWTFAVIYSFGNNSSDGVQPEDALIFDPAGNLYGTTVLGGAHNYGTVFELSRNAGHTWTNTILHSFNDDGRDGFTPVGSLVLDTAGNLYGTTAAGGDSKSCVNFQAPTCGTVFEVARKGGVWLEKILFDFDFTTAGANPDGSLTLDAAGNLYGTTSQGGAFSYGTLFELTRPTSGAWTETTLHQFGMGTDGVTPYAGAIFGTNGSLYGTTLYGGAGYQGTVFEITP